MPRTCQPLRRLLTTCVAGSSGCNHNSTISFDLSLRLFSFQVICVWCFDLKLLFFLYFFFLSFFLKLRVGHAKNHFNPSIYFFFWFSPFFLIVLFTLIIFNWILFFISSLVILFYFFQIWTLFFLITICFVLNHFLYWFVFLPTPPLGIYFHSIFMSNLILIFSIDIFLFIFLMDFFLQFHLIFKSNLIIILLISIFFCFALFFIKKFSQFYPSIFVWLRILILCFLGLSLIEPSRSHDSSNRSEGIPQVDFNLFLKHFFISFLTIYFFLLSYL